MSGGGPAPGQLSVPQRRTVRPLRDDEAATLVAVADHLCGGGPRPSELEGYPALLEQALALRGDVFGEVVALLSEASGRGLGLDQFLRELHDRRPHEFEAVSNVVAGAYLMAPQVRTLIGYPGQPGHRPRPDEAADDILAIWGSGIPDPAPGSDAGSVQEEAERVP